MSSISKAEYKQLRSLRKKHAPEVLRLCNQIKKASKRLMQIDAKIEEEASAIAGDINVCFQSEGSNQYQMETYGFVQLTDFESVWKMATEIGTDARCALYRK